MANLLSIAELAFRQIFPNPGDETELTKYDFIETAKTEYAYQMLLFYWKQMREEGEFNLPSHLLSEEEMDVVNNRIDISGLKIFRALPDDFWLQNIGGFDCKCKYVKSNLNLTQLLCDDDSLPDTTKTFLPLGKEIIFPKGAHASKITIIYANMGEKINEEIEVDDAIGGVVRTRLIDIYKTMGKEDSTNNSDSNI